MRDLLNKLTLFESTQEGFDPETFDFDFQFDAIGDDGEETTCTISATANIEEGKPVVDPKSLSIDCPMDGNSKLGFDADIDLEMQDMDDMMNVAQEEADEQWAERDNKYSQGENVGEDAFDKVDRITDPVELNLYGPEDIENNSQLSAEELKDELKGDIYHLMNKASDDFTDNDHIADEMGDHFANMHLKADDKTLSCYIAMRDLIDADPADVYETGKKCLKILGAQEHQDQEQGNKGPKGRPAADAYAGGMESTNDELARIKELAGASIDETYDDDDAFYEAYGEMWYNEDDIVDEAEYQGRKVKLGKPMQGDVKKFKVYVKDPKTGNVKKVNFGHGGSSVKGKAMSIKKSNPKRRKSFRARHNCDNPGPRTKARYWSCRKW